MKLNVDITFVSVKDSSISCSKTTSYPFSNIIHFKIIHNRFMTSKILHRMKSADDPNCLYEFMEMYGTVVERDRC